MSDPIYTGICKISDVALHIQTIWIEKYNLTEEYSGKIIEKTIGPYIKSLKDNLYAIVEYPYVDKMYRDTYYNYYSSKLEQYHRDTIRISFFNKEIVWDDFRNYDKKKLIETEHQYLGFLTIRPTFPKIIGRTALSTKAKKEDNILCCLAKINSTVNFVKYKVNCFPHSSQDNQAITCAETTIWALLEYFGNKYPEYKPVLPSTIHKILHKFSYKRLMPSEGLTAEQVTYAVRELGFGAMIYSQSRYPDTFDSIISAYIESGIPIVAVLSNSDNDLGHAVNIVGREIDNVEKILNAQTKIISEEGADKIEIIDYNDIERKYVFIDDNHPPYQIANLANPCLEYYDEKKWHGCTITNIIVPLYPKIYLEANRARHNFFQYLKNPRIGIKSGEVRIIKVFLASSRSYKEYLALNEELDKDLKELFLGATMPKFIWIAEISTKGNFVKKMCDGIIMQDATEPIKYTDSTTLGSLTLISGYLDGKYFTQMHGKFKEVAIFAGEFNSYKNNLK